jgi:hypothetical protein
MSGREGSDIASEGLSGAGRDALVRSQISNPPAVRMDLRKGNGW